MVLLLGLSLAMWQAEPAADHRAVIRRAVELYQKAEGNSSRFLFIRRREERQYDSGGSLRSKKSFTTRRERFDGKVITRLIARDDQPLTERELEEQAARIREAMAAEQAKAAAGPGASQPRRESEEAQIVREFPDALDYALTGSEMKAGRNTLVYAFSPRPGYAPRSLKLKVFEKLRGTMWIDKASGEIAGVDAEVFDHVNVAFGLLGKIGKGTTFRMARKEAAPGLWVPESINLKFNARFLLVKTIQQAVDTTYSEFALMSPAVSAPK